MSGNSGMQRENGNRGKREKGKKEKGKKEKGKRVFNKAKRKRASPVEGLRLKIGCVSTLERILARLQSWKMCSLEVCRG